MIAGMSIGMFIVIVLMNLVILWLVIGGIAFKFGFWGTFTVGIMGKALLIITILISIFCATKGF